MIYTDINDRQATQLAQRVGSWPYYRLSESAKQLVRSNTVEYITKKEIIDNLIIEDQVDYLNYNDALFRVKWAYGLTPTKQEWEDSPLDRIICVEHRVSPAIPGRRIAIISWRS
jgi:hypothetical protein